MNRAMCLVGMFLLSFCPAFVNAQSYITYRDLDAVKIDYIITACGEDPNTITEYNFIRLQNKTDHAISVSFHIEYYFSGACTTCNDKSYQVSFKIPAHETITTDCSGLTSANGHLAVIKRYVNRNYGPPLDRFELSNLIVQ